MSATGNKLFQGIYPALITPFDEAGNLKRDSVGRLIDRQLASGVDGFYICGGTGEGPLISEKCRMDMAEAAMESARGRCKIIAHVGAIDVNSSFRLARHAHELGCDAISSLAPMYYASYSESQLVDYYRALAETTPLPLLIYATDMMKIADITGFTRRIMEIHNIIGLKYTRFNYYEMQKLTLLNDGDINVINGPDEMLLCGLAMGADAGIGSTYNIMPARYVELYKKFRQGDIRAAQNIQFGINRVITVLLEYGVVPSIKSIFAGVGIDCGYAAYPGRRISAGDSDSLNERLREAGFYDDFAE